MKVTLLSHFYNEEYLLPWWLKHHCKIFDDAILIDYNSTDNSVEIIKEYCPNWTVVRSENDAFDAEKVDKEVMKYEESIGGYKMCLNTTEFIFGDILSELRDDGLNCFKINSISIVDDNPSDVLTYDDNIIEKKKFGFPNGCRFIHNYPSGKYSVGRHSSHLPINKTLNTTIRHLKYAPWTEEFIKRKLQISKKIPKSDIQKGMGGHHIWTKEEMEYEMMIKMKVSSF